MKRHINKLMALLLTAALAVGLAACTEGPAATPTPEELGKTCTGTAQGYGGEVTVTLTVKGGVITECKAEGAEETESIGGQALAPMAEAVQKANGVDVDTVSGATVTSNAVIAAATAALIEAGVMEAPKAGVMTAGSYTSTSHGYTSEITIKTTVSEKEILAVEVVEQDDTVGIGSYALERMPAMMVAQQTAMVDTVSGATATSMAVRSAVLDGLKQAGADMTVFSKVPVVPVPADVTLDTDVVIIGAGAAGLAAGVEALDKGTSVIVLEKMDIPGGNTVRSSGAFNVAGHPEQIAADAKRSGVEEFIEYTMTGGHNINDPDLVSYMVENSAAIVDWTRALGFDTKFGETFGSCTVPGVARGMITGFWEKLEERGGELMLSTKAEEILMKDGKVAGVLATGADGEKVTINAKAVIVATGGFGYNLEMCYELKPEFDGFVTNNHVGATGDGIVMASAVGAATVDMEQIQAHPTVNQPTATMLTEGCRTAGSLLINTSGERFIDECNYRDVVANAILAQDQKYAYLLMNQEIVDSNVNIKGYIKLGILTQYDTIAAAAEVMKVPAETLEKTVATWNGYVANKSDPDFNSRFEWLRDLSTGPWYVAQVAPGIHHTMGGLKINTATEVLDAAGAAIPGLFACGEVTGGVHGGNRVGGNAILDCLVFGRASGDSSAAYVAK